MGVIGMCKALISLPKQMWNQVNQLIFKPIKICDKDSGYEHWYPGFYSVFRLLHFFYFFLFFKSSKGNLDKQMVHMPT